MHQFIVVFEWNNQKIQKTVFAQDEDHAVEAIRTLYDGVRIIGVIC